MVVKTEIGDDMAQLLDHSGLVTGNKEFSGPLHTELLRSVDVSSIARGAKAMQVCLGG